MIAKDLIFIGDIEVNNNMIICGFIEGKIENDWLSSEGNALMERKINIYINKYKTSIYLSLPASLTETECVLLFQLLRGKSLTEIAKKRYRSVKTVSCQKGKIYKKLGVKNDLTLWRDILLGFVYKAESVNSLNIELFKNQFNLGGERYFSDPDERLDDLI